MEAAEAALSSGMLYLLICIMLVVTDLVFIFLNRANGKPNALKHMTTVCSCSLIMQI